MSWSSSAESGPPVALFSLSYARWAKAPPMVLVAAYAHSAISEISGTTIRLMSVDRIDRGRARRAWEAFTLLMVSPVVIDRQRGSPTGSVKPQSLDDGR